MASPIYERQGFGVPKGRQPGVRVQHFALAGKRGETAPTLVDYILLAEFDIDSGRWAVCVALLVLVGSAFRGAVDSDSSPNKLYCCLNHRPLPYNRS